MVGNSPGRFFLMLSMTPKTKGLVVAGHDWISRRQLPMSSSVQDIATLLEPETTHLVSSFTGSIAHQKLRTHADSGQEDSSAPGRCSPQAATPGARCPMLPAKATCPHVPHPTLIRGSRHVRRLRDLLEVVPAPGLAGRGAVRRQRHALSTTRFEG